MNKYELTLVVNAKIEDDERAAAVEKAKEIITRFGGTVTEVEDAGKKRLAYEIQKMKEAGAKRAVMLPVSAPFHSRLMEPAALRLKEELDKIQVSDAQIPVVANVTGKILTNANEIKESLVTQAANPVLWEDCVAEMINFGVTRFVEVGPGKVLTGFTKKINTDMELANVEDIASLEKTLEFLKGVR